MREYIVKLNHTTIEGGRKALEQIIAASDADAAICAAKKTFQARLFLFSGATPCGSEVQRLDRLCRRSGSWRFGFKSGWVTRHLNNESLSDARASAAADPFAEGSPIEEAYCETA